MNKAFLSAAVTGLLLASCASATDSSDDRMMMDNDRMEEEMTDEMMENDNGMMTHDEMTMGMMMERLEGKTGDDFDKAFIEAMIPHHQGAIDMAQAALRDAGHQEIKDLAADIIEAQQREIDMMNGWLEQWGLDE